MSTEVPAWGKYSVLMSVYAGADPNQLVQALDSMLCQTLPADDLVLVCDGPLTPGLDAVVNEYASAFPDTVCVLRRPVHEGLVAALNAGLPLCRQEFVARMDSDDISLPHRCETQLRYLMQHRELSIVSGIVLEFMDTPNRITGQRALPASHGELCRFSRKRSPFNHPGVMYRKSAVAAVGGYQKGAPLFEDYDLWVRMFVSGFRGENLQEPILFMRTGMQLYRRRGGRRYAVHLLGFHRKLYRSRWSNLLDYWMGAMPHAALCLLPTYRLAEVYRWLHWKGEQDEYPHIDRWYGSL